MNRQQYDWASSVAGDHKPTVEELEEAVKDYEQWVKEYGND